MQHFHVRVGKDDLVFSASHFLPISDDACEPLHGHDYRVAAEVHGPLDEDHCVVDFLALHATLHAVVAELDHCILLPTGHPSIGVRTRGQEIEVTCGQRRWILPRSDCRLLPLASTTTELLARHLGQRMLEELQSRLGLRPTEVSVEVQESCGFSAVWRLVLSQEP